MTTEALFPSESDGPPASGRATETADADRAGAAAPDQSSAAAGPPSPRSTAADILRAVGTGLAGGALALLVLLGIAVVAVPAVSGAQTYTIAGRSMEPTLPLGSLVVVRPVDPAALRIGDVITFQLEPDSDVVATHRIVAVTVEGMGTAAGTSEGGLRFSTAGDNNDGAADVEPVVPEQIRGEVWYSIPVVGWIGAAFGPVRSWLLPLAIGALFVYAGWMLTTGVAQAVRRRTDRADSADRTDRPDREDCL